jgi:hypothetical protein
LTQKRLAAHKNPQEIDGFSICRGACLTTKRSC